MSLLSEKHSEVKENVVFMAKPLTLVLRMKTQRRTHSQTNYLRFNQQAQRQTKKRLSALSYI